MATEQPAAYDDQSAYDQGVYDQQQPYADQSAYDQGYDQGYYGQEEYYQQPPQQPKELQQSKRAATISEVVQSMRESDAYNRCVLRSRERLRSRGAHRCMLDGVHACCWDVDARRLQRLCGACNPQPVPYLCRSRRLRAPVCVAACRPSVWPASSVRHLTSTCPRPGFAPADVPVAVRCRNFRC